MRRPATAALLLGVIAVPRAARADDYSIHVLGHVQTSWTDNLFSAPEDAEPMADFYTQIRPGLLLSYETPRAIYEASYGLEGSLYTENDDAWALGHLASLRGFFVTSPRSELNASATFSTGTIATLQTRAEPTPQAPGPQSASGDNTYWSLEAGEGLSYSLSRDVRLSQGLRARRFSTTDGDNQSGGSELGLNVGADRGWKHSAVAIGLAGAYVMLDPTGATETGDSLNTSAVVSYRRDFSPRWTALIDGGVAAVIPLGDADLFVQPTVGTNIGYAPNWGAAGLQIRRSMAPNLQLGQNTVTDSAMLNASLPLPWLTNDPNQPKLTTASSIGISRTQQVNNGDLVSATDVANIDLSVQYQPRLGLGFAVRGQHLRQIAEDTGPPPPGATVATSYHRTTVIISATWRFPDRTAATVPLRDSLRVDRSDNTPVGEEVAPSVAP